MNNDINQNKKTKSGPFLTETNKSKMNKYKLALILNLSLE